MAQRTIWTPWFILIICIFSIYTDSYNQTAHAQSNVQHKQDENFNPASTAWNGLSSFVSEAQSLGLDVHAPQHWNWSHADIRTPIILIALRDEQLSIQPLKRFIAAGGRVFLADDFGTGDRIWRAFGLHKVRTPLATPFTGRKSLDLHTTQPAPYQEADLLLRQAGILFLNLPQWLKKSKRHIRATSLLRSTVYASHRYDRHVGSQVLWKISHGRGQLIVFSDPSALINQMIAYGDNHRFVRNVLRYLVLPMRSKKLLLLRGNVEWSGICTHTSQWTASLSASWWDTISQLNTALTSPAALYKAYPPLWKKQQSQSPTSVQHKINALSWAHTQVKMHRLYLSHNYMLFVTLLLCTLGIMLRFWVRLDVFRTTYSLELPHRFDEHFESYNDGIQNYLSPLLVVREELALFLLDELDITVPSQYLHDTQENATFDLSRYVVHQVEKKIQTGQLSRAFERHQKQLRRLLFEHPSTHTSHTDRVQKVQQKNFVMYYQSILLYLRSVQLEDAFREAHLPPQRHHYSTYSQRSTP